MDQHSDRHHVVDIQLGCTDGAGKSTSAMTADGMRGRSDPIAPSLPPPASKEGNVGEYWYHGDTAAYFQDEQQDEEATDTCKKTRPRYGLWVRAKTVAVRKLTEVVSFADFKFYYFQDKLNKIVWAREQVT